MHPLKRYLKDRSLTADEFAAQIGSTSSYLSQIICGHRRPSVEMARKIEAATGGDVKAGELLLWERTPPDLDTTAAPASPAVTE